ncbi:SDR family oxidoreductase [Streptomyces sp. NPDC023838]|uniref:SDR family oxidoreductase n=1 Tax=Streptomyces sp. NPDC023838 TaxID=3154325 RepID=UPI0033F555E0
MLTLYSATKAASHNLARTLAAVLALRKIRVNSVSPGYIDTPMYPVEALTRAEAGRVTGQIVVGRFGRPEEVAAAVAFLASPDALYINGRDLVVDGGLTGASLPDTRPNPQSYVPPPERHGLSRFDLHAVRRQPVRPAPPCLVRSGASEILKSSEHVIVFTFTPLVEPSTSDAQSRFRPAVMRFFRSAMNSLGFSGWRIAA